MTTTLAEAVISFDAKKNRGKSRSNSGGGSKKDHDRVRLCGLSYLVVDDSRFTRSTIKDALHGIGIRTIVEMEGAEAALGHAEKHPVDVIVTDFEMPGMNGAEFVWKLRHSENERVRRIPVVMVSDYADEGHVRAAIGAGINEYLPKPFSQSDLYYRLHRSVFSPKLFVVAPGYVGPARRISEDKSRQNIERRCGLSPADLLGAPAQTEMAPANANPAPAPAKPTVQPKPSFSALSETDPSGQLKTRIGDKGEVD
ncbi:MAG: response regulator [Rhodospirillales bacterium]|nr:response regulator [Rhodospirillales bacterium]MSP80157.1 response regulator [Rhodospirillales bacterium]